MSVKDNYERILDTLEHTRSRLGITYPITVVAVTKTFGPECVREAIESGIQHIGENRVQEAEDKFRHLKDMPFTRHLIGHLQSNKINKALQWFDVIQSVDSVALAEGISKRLHHDMPIFIEVNTSGEPSKHGLSFEEAKDTIARIKELPHLVVRGLMTVGPLTDDTRRIRQAFASLRKLRDEVEGWFSSPLELSMGMSDDYLLAIEEGSTMVRLGRILFGSRS